jgi:lipoprotein NlpI
MGHELLNPLRNSAIPRVIAILLLTVPVTVFAQDKAYDAAVEGYDKYKKGDLDGAIADFTRSIEANPQYAYAYLHRGMARYGKGQLKEALEDANKVIEITPQDADAYLLRGVIAENRDELENALRDYTRATEIDPKSKSAFNDRGTVKGAMGDLDGSIADLTKAIELDNTYADAFYNRAISETKKGDSKAAFEDFDKAIEMNPKRASYYSMRSRAHVMTENYDDAIKDLDKAIELAPQDVRLLKQRGLAHLYRREPRRALDDLKKFAQSEGKQKDYVQITIWIAHNQLNEPVLADKELAQYLASRTDASPDDWSSKIASFLLGKMTEKDFLAAANSKSEATDKNQHCEAWFYVGAKQLFGGNQSAAAEDFKKCLATNVKTYVEYTLAEIELKALEKR